MARRVEPVDRRPLLRTRDVAQRLSLSEYTVAEMSLGSNEARRSAARWSNQPEDQADADGDRSDRKDQPDRDVTGVLHELHGLMPAATIAAVA